MFAISNSPKSGYEGIIGAVLEKLCEEVGLQVTVSASIQIDIEFVQLV